MVQQQQVDICARVFGRDEVTAHVRWCWYHVMFLLAYAVRDRLDITHNRLTERPAVLARMSQLVKYVFVCQKCERHLSLTCGIVRVDV